MHSDKNALESRVYELERGQCDLALHAMVVPMCAYLGAAGLAYLTGVSHAGGGSLAAANSIFNGGYGMRIRNKMRELLGYPNEQTLPEHFYDNSWERLIRMCLEHAAKQNCRVCDGSGVIRPLPDGPMNPRPVEPCPVCSKRNEARCQQIADALGVK